MPYTDRFWPRLPVVFGPCLSARPRGFRRGAALTLVFGAVLATGAATGSFGETTRVVTARAAGTDEIAKAIDNGKVGPQAAQALVSRSGDRWSAFYTAQEYEGFQQSLDGRYVGVGLWVRRKGDGRIVIARVQDDSPAAGAGIRAGDRIQTIDGVEVTGRAVTQVVARLRGSGRAGTSVRLGLRRDGRSWDAALHRALLPAETVTVRRLAHGVTSVKIDAFTKGVGTRVREAIRDSGKAGTPAPTGLLLDLRGNSGGLVTEAVSVASDFLDGGLVATYDVHGKQRSLYADTGGDTRIPLVVLVDGGTMSAAELLSGALQDRGRAVVIGARTFGKGSVQMPSRLSDGSVAELTVGHYRLPGGRSVDGVGVEPDVEVGPDADAPAKAREVLGGLGTPP